MLWQTQNEDVLPNDPTDEVKETARDILESILETLPLIGIAIVVLVVSYLIARGVRSLLRSRLSQDRSESFARVFSKLGFAAVIALGVLTAVTVVFPSVKPGDLIAGLGVFSIAIGFAFQDILSNLLAGILILLRQPFEIGDQIEVEGQAGTVEDITIRETQLRTFGGEKIVIPNAEVYQSVVRVQTAYGPKRTVLEVGLDDHEDQDNATDVVLEAVRSVDGVKSDPEPQVFFTGFGDSTTNFDLRYWTDPEQATVRSVQDRVVRAVSRALKDAGIDMPSPIRELDARPSLAETFAGQS
ncbi:MAG: mechanosensitive ion channel family protein [Acidimicrobiia bacterium]|nr:mechanosensitive ion channel family protein [Acidimicrobiia bacterium]MBT8217119.1 mechanosensitive ion channel family protein [Acidimicrobiia bacterium]NNF10922.1 mechanosensitive ion channel family protein [Acidimicrobiia bacterium]NNL71649.1 mechanosensitive ion channel family protein [Acidimicrobiia bacterium]